MDFMWNWLIRITQIYLFFTPKPISASFVFTYDPEKFYWYPKIDFMGNWLIRITQIYLFFTLKPISASFVFTYDPEKKYWYPKMDFMGNCLIRITQIYLFFTLKPINWTIRITQIPPPPRVRSLPSNVDFMVWIYKVFVHPTQEANSNHIVKNRKNKRESLVLTKFLQQRKTGKFTTLLSTFPLLPIIEGSH